MKVRAVDDPEPGFFRTRLVKGGPYVAARIRRTCACTINGPRVHDWRDDCDRFPPLIADIDGEETSLDRVWHGGEPISEDMWTYYTQNRAWAIINDETQPEANAGKKVDLLTCAIPTF